MKDEVAREVEYMQMVIKRLDDYGVELKERGEVPFSKLSASLRERSNELLKQVHASGKDVRALAQRYADENGETEPVAEIKKIAGEIAGEWGGLQAVVDMVTGELPGFGNPNKSSGEIGKDFVRSSDYLKKLANRLEKIARPLAA